MRRVCGRRSRTLSRSSGELRCGPLAGLLGSGEDASVRAHLPAAAGFKEALAVGCVMCGLTGALLPEADGGAEGGALITPLKRVASSEDWFLN